MQPTISSFSKTNSTPSPQHPNSSPAPQDSTTAQSKYTAPHQQTNKPPAREPKIHQSIISNHPLPPHLVAHRAINKAKRNKTRSAALNANYYSQRGVLTLHRLHRGARLSRGQWPARALDRPSGTHRLRARNSLFFPCPMHFGWCMTPVNLSRPSGKYLEKPASPARAGV